MSRSRRKHDDATRDSFTTNGRADLDMQRQAAACSAIGLKQWAGVVVHLIR